MFLEGKTSSVGGRPLDMVIREDFFMEAFFLDGTCLGKMTGSKKEVMVVEVFVCVI